MTILPHSKPTTFFLLAFIIGTIMISLRIINGYGPFGSQTRIPTTTADGNGNFQNHIESNAQPSPTSENKELKTETKYLFNPSKTYAFFFRSQIPAFSTDNLSQDMYGLTDNPTKLCFNGDTSYAIPSKKYVAHSGQYIITPVVIDLKTNQVKVVNQIGDVKAANGCVKILGWKDDTHVQRNRVAGDLNYYNETESILVVE